MGLLRFICNWLENHFSRYFIELRETPIVLHAKSWPIDILKFDGVFLLALEGKGKRGECMQHSILVDGSMKRVYSSAEKYQLALKEEVIHVCVENEFKLVKVTDLRQVVRQQKGSGRN